MQKFKLGKYKVVIYAAAILLIGAGVLFTSITVAQGAEENRIVSEQSEKLSLDTALASQTGAGIPDTAPIKAKPEANSTPAPMATPTPAVTTASTPGPEFITEDEAKEAYIKTAADIFRMNIDKSELTAAFYTETAPHEWWIVYGPKSQCYIDAVSGEVLRFSTSGRKYTGKLITLEEANTDQYCTDIAEDPNNAYSKMATEIVTSKLANGRNIESVGNPGIQFVWDNDKDGLDPKAKGTKAFDVVVLMETGRSYRFTFWGTEEIELYEFSSHPTQDACHWYYFYEDQADEYTGHA